MTKKEALNELIGFAVCCDKKLHCDIDCPFYNENNGCDYIDKEFELAKAVKTLKGVNNG